MSNAEKIAEKFIPLEMIYLTDDCCGERAANLRSFQPNGIGTSC